MQRRVYFIMYSFIFVVFAIGFLPIKTFAQPKPKVGIFVPLHLDSVFSNTGAYKYGATIPKFALSGLEFYSGAQLAIDSLQQEGIFAEIFFVDSKAKSQSAGSFITKNLSDAALLIGMVQNVAELKILADAAYQKSIPFISATYPNDGGAVGNPSLIVLNATLKTHTQAIYKFIQKNYRADNIIVLKKPGTQEDKIKMWLDEANKNTAPIKLKWVSVADTTDAALLSSFMDSTKNNLCICASLDEGFGNNLVEQLAALQPTYHCSIIGMPNWDGLKFDKPSLKNLEIIYSTPFLTQSGNGQVYNAITKKFTAKAHSRPSDMVFKGFEITYRYIKNMLAHQDAIVDLSDRAGKIFSDFDIQPVKIKTELNQPDYYENKKIYFIKKLAGAVKVVN